MCEQFKFHFIKPCGLFKSEVYSYAGSSLCVHYLTLSTYFHRFDEAPSHPKERFVYDLVLVCFFHGVLWPGLQHTRLRLEHLLGFCLPNLLYDSCVPQPALYGKQAGPQTGHDFDYGACWIMSSANFGCAQRNNCHYIRY